jgi:uncharacterized membrane protein YfcA
VDLLEISWIVIPVSILAGIVRGYSGFGFAAVAVVGFNTVLNPQQSIPVILALDVLCSVGLWQQARQQSDYKTFRVLTIGAFVGIPFGLLFLLLIPENILKLIICLFIFFFALLLLFDLKIKSADKLSVKFGFGLGSGIGTASASIGGPVIVSYMLASTLSASAQRATMILFFIVSETVALCVLLFSGLMGQQEFILLLVLILPTLIAVRIGQSLFNAYPPKSLKHFALPVMALVAVLGLGTSINSLI